MEFPEEIVAEDIPESYLDKWQKLIDLVAKIFDVPAALIMRFKEPFLEVFLSSKTDESNPYKVGDKEHKYGLYCETVINSGKELNIPNALEIPEWSDNPDIKLGMVNYLGVPINWPTGQSFGTICVLDRKTREYNKNFVELMYQFADLINSNLKVLHKEAVIESQEQTISSLKELVYVCSYCRKLKDPDNDRWVPFEQFFEESYDRKSSHGICEECYDREFEN